MDLIADFREQRGCFGFGIAADAQVNLHIGVVGEDGGDRVFVACVDGRDELVEIRFGHAGDAKFKRADHGGRHAFHEARQALAGEHRLQFVGRAGQNNDGS